MRVSESEADSYRLQNEDSCRKKSGGGEQLRGRRHRSTCGLDVDAVTDQHPSQLSCGLHRV